MGNPGGPAGLKGYEVTVQGAISRQAQFPNRKSDRFIVAMKWGNAHGAKGATKFGLEDYIFRVGAAPRKRKNMSAPWLNVGLQIGLMRRKRQRTEND